MNENVQSSNAGSKPPRRRAKPETATPEPTSAPVETSLPASEASSQPPQSHKREPARTEQPPMTEADKADAVAALFETPTDENTPPDFIPRAGVGEGGGEEDGPLDDTSAPPSDFDDEHVSDDTSTPHDDGDAPVSLADLAEALEIEPKELYDIDIPLGNGESVSLGEMKDAYRDVNQAEKEYHARRSQVDQREANMFNEQHMMQNVLEALKPQLTPELVNYIQQHDRQVDFEERAAIGRIIPEMKDQTSRAQFLERAVKRMANVTGRSEEEAVLRLNMIRGRGSALDIKFLHAAIEAFEELDRLKGFKVQAERPRNAPDRRSGGPKGLANGLTRARKLAAGGTNADMARAVSELLKG